MSLKYNLITGNQFKEKIDIKAFMKTDELFEALFSGAQNYKDVITIQGDFIFDGNLTNLALQDILGDIEEKDEILHVYIDGNLVVHGDMNPEQETLPNIFVTGDLYADNIENGEHLVIIGGDMHIKNMVFCQYNHGVLHVHGATTAKYIINYDHEMRLNNIKTGLVVNAYLDRSDHQPEYNPMPYTMFKDDLVEKLKPEYITKDTNYGIDQVKLNADLNDGKEVLKPSEKIAGDSILSESYHSLLEKLKKGYILETYDFYISSEKLIPDIKANIEIFK